MRENLVGLVSALWSLYGWEVAAIVLSAPPLALYLWRTVNLLGRGES